MRVDEQALTFDDVLLVPAYSQVLPREVSLITQLTRNISLNIPIISAAMDTVTEARLAIALAQEGGIGIIHKNMSAEAQALQVRAVKKYESGVIKDPITVTPDMVGEKIAVFCSAELKKVKGKAEEEQKNWLQQVENAGGIGGIVRNIDDYNKIFSV